MTALRLTPPLLFGGRRHGLLIERNIYVYRRTWMLIFSGFFQAPVLSTPGSASALRR